MVKRITAGLMLIVLCIGLCACGGGSSTKDGSSDSVGAFADQSGGGEKYPGNPDEIDYPKVSDPKNSDLALTDTLTGNKVYIGQSKAEVEQFYGKGEVKTSSIYYENPGLWVDYDDNDCIEDITIFNNILDSSAYPNYYADFPENKAKHAAKNERFKTDKGLTLNNSFEDFQKAYKRKYRMSRSSYMVGYNDKNYLLWWPNKNDNLVVDRIWISYFNPFREPYEHRDYGDPEKIKNSDLAITDTKTGKQIYFGQSKKEVEEILGEAYAIEGIVHYIYADGLSIRFDDKWCVNQIALSTGMAENKARYKTHRGFDLCKTPEDFKALYNTESEEAEIEQNGMKFSISINMYEGKVRSLSLEDSALKEQ